MKMLSFIVERPIIVYNFGKHHPLVFFGSAAAGIESSRTHSRLHLPTWLEVASSSSSAAAESCARVAFFNTSLLDPTKHILIDATLHECRTEGGKDPKSERDRKAGVHPF